MTAGTGAIRAGDTIFGPATLPPPPTRHALFLIVLGLAALVQFATIRTGQFFPGESRRAETAREMWRAHNLIVPTANSVPLRREPPLYYWLLIASFKLFGMTEWAARLPNAFAIVATTALLFEIGERLANYWRGFTAALIYLSLAGVSIFGHMITPAPVVALWMTATIFSALGGYRNRKQRRWWFAGAWVAAAMTCCAGGWLPFLESAVALGMLALLHRETRSRFRTLFGWPYLAVFAVLVIPYLMNFQRSPNFSLAAKVTRDEFLTAHLLFLFPWWLAILPSLLFEWRRVVRPGAREFSNDLPPVWAAAIFITVLLAGPIEQSSAFALFGAFALWAAAIWERSSANARLGGAITVVVFSAIASLVFLLRSNSRWLNFPAGLSSGIPTFAWLIAISLGTGVVITVWLTLRRDESIAIVGLALAMIPVGFAVVTAGWGLSALRSFEESGRFLRTNLGADGEILFEGSPSAAGSLDFYLDRRCTLVNQPETASLPDMFASESAALDRLARPHPVFLLIDQDRTAHWREILTQRFHQYHQVASCGRYVILSNQM